MSAKRCRDCGHAANQHPVADKKHGVCRHAVKANGKGCGCEGYAANLDDVGTPLFVEFDGPRRGYLVALSKGGGRGDAAASVRRTRGAVYHWRKNDPAFLVAELEAEASGVGEVESWLYASAKDGSVKAQIFILVNRAPDRWKNPTKVELTGADDGPVAVSFADVDVAEIQAMAARLAEEEG